MKQISIFDALGRPQPLPLGYARNGERLKGDMIPFASLGNYIGKQVLLEMPRQSAVDYKVIMVTGFDEASDPVYETRFGNTVDTGKRASACSYSDNDRTKKTNARVSELFCKNGRYETSRYPECMYEIRRAEDA